MVDLDLEVDVVARRFFMLMIKKNNEVPMMRKNHEVPKFRV
jgi:hypothetical protein